MYLQNIRNNGYFNEGELIIRKNAFYHIYVGGCDLVICGRDNSKRRLPMTLTPNNEFKIVNLPQYAVYPLYLQRALLELSEINFYGSDDYVTRLNMNGVKIVW